LMVLSVSIDKEAEQIEFVRKLAKDSGVVFPVLSDRFNIVAKRYYIAKLPCVYLVNGEGKVSMVNVGYNDDISKTLLDSIRKAIGEATSDPVPEALARYMTGHAGPATVDAKIEPPADPPTGDGKVEAAAEGDTKAKGKGKNKGKGGKGKAPKTKKKK